MKNKLGFLRISQKYHEVETSKGRIVYGSCSYTISLSFRAGLRWVIGRQPQVKPNEEAIYIPTLLASRQIADLYASKVGRVPVHVLDLTSSKHNLLSEPSKEIVSRTIILKNDEHLSLEGLPLSLDYKIKEVGDGKEQDEFSTYY